MERVICAVRNQVNKFNRHSSGISHDAFDLTKGFLEDNIRVDTSVKEYVPTIVEMRATFLGIPYKYTEVKNVPVYQTRILVRGGVTYGEYFIDDNLELYNFVADNVTQRELEKLQKVIDKFCSVK